MERLKELLADDAITTILVGFVAPIVLAILAWVSGFGRWIGQRIEEWIRYRREQGRAEKELRPKRTLLIEPDGSIFAPTLQDAEWGKGKSATRASAVLWLTGTFLERVFIVE